MHVNLQTKQQKYVGELIKNNTEYETFEFSKGPSQAQMSFLPGALGNLVMQRIKRMNKYINKILTGPATP